MNTTDTTPGFVKGGIRPADPTADLPPISIVEQGSVYRAADGRYWMAWVNNGRDRPTREWMPARQITHAEQLHLRTMAGISGVFAGAALALIIAAIVTFFATNQSTGGGIFMVGAVLALGVAIGMSLAYEGKLHLTFVLAPDGTAHASTPPRA